MLTKVFVSVYMDAPHIVDAQPVGDAKSSEEKHENDDTVASSVHSTDAISKVKSHSNFFAYLLPAFLWSFTFGLHHKNACSHKYLKSCKCK